MSEDDKDYPHTDEHRAKGDWNPRWEPFREIDADLLEACLAFRSVPQARGPLPQKYREWILMDEVARQGG